MSTGIVKKKNFLKLNDSNLKSSGRTVTLLLDKKFYRIKMCTNQYCYLEEMFSHEYLTSLFFSWQQRIIITIA
jgi:hypothetical protein